METTKNVLFFFFFLHSKGHSGESASGTDWEVVGRRDLKQLENGPKEDW